MAWELVDDNSNSGVFAGACDVVNVQQPGLDLESGDLTKIGANPILINENNYGVDLMVNILIDRFRREGSIYLLRFHGHGIPGVQSISCGMKIKNAELPSMRSVIAAQNINHIQSTLARMKEVFSSDAEVWLMGCFVGANPHGPELVRRLAQIWGVTVKAGTGEQLGGGTDTFAIEGTVIFASP